MKFISTTFFLTIFFIAFSFQVVQSAVSKPSQLIAWHQVYLNLSISVSTADEPDKESTKNFFLQLKNFFKEISVLRHFFLNWSELKVISVAAILVLLINAIAFISNWNKKLDIEIQEKRRLRKDLKDEKDSM